MARIVSEDMSDVLPKFERKIVRDKRTTWGLPRTAFCPFRRPNHNSFGSCWTPHESCREGHTDLDFCLRFTIHRGIFLRQRKMVFPIVVVLTTSTGIGAALKFLINFVTDRSAWNLRGCLEFESWVWLVSRPPSPENTLGVTHQKVTNLDT